MASSCRETDRVNGNLSQLRGDASEELAAIALHHMATRQITISDWWFASESEEQSGVGADYHVVRIADDSIIEIQIKSSVSGLRKHMHKHPDIPCCVILHPDWPLEKAITELDRGIRNTPVSLL